MMKSKYEEGEKKRKRNETFLPLPFPEYLMIYEVGFVAKQQQKLPCKRNTSQGGKKVCANLVEHFTWQPCNENVFMKSKHCSFVDDTRNLLTW